MAEHLSLVGSEAAGTTQIKFMMNGVICLGSSDATNIEIAKAVGPNNIFIFTSQEG
jgi:glycogen phosphorylase